GRALDRINEQLAGEQFEGVRRSEIARAEINRRVADLHALALQVSVLHRDGVVGEVDLEDVLDVVVGDALDAETGATELRRAHVWIGRDRRVLIDVLVFGLDASADLEGKLLPIRARELRRSLPRDLEVDIAAFGSRISRGGVRRGGLRLGVLHLLLQCLDGGLHLIDLRLDLLHILRFVSWRANCQKSDNARPREQIAAGGSQSPNHSPVPSVKRRRLYDSPTPTIRERFCSYKPY